MLFYLVPISYAFFIFYSYTNWEVCHNWKDDYWVFSIQIIVSDSWIDILINLTLRLSKFQTFDYFETTHKKYLKKYGPLGESGTDL